jgi:pimeloyl-ACP methyl ester carboxylesterase
MAKFFAWCLTLACLAGLAGAAEKPQNYQWTVSEMNPRLGKTGGRQLHKIPDVRLLPEDQPFPKRFNCHDEECKFDLYFFTGQGFSLKNPKRKNILFIAGGPGQVVDTRSPDNRMLGFLEANHNVVYFDLRGGGRSVIPADNKYDSFLRAEYVADDIERIRKTLLNKKPWDAIYTHSWGSVPAQLYAARFGSAKVKSLVLSAPVVRDRDTNAARTQMTVDNLEHIYRIYRSQSSQGCSCQDTTLPVKVNTLQGGETANQHDVRAVVGPPGTNNFCFFSLDEVPKLGRRLEQLLDKIEDRYGSVDFVTDHYDALQKNINPKERLRYPREFYVALKRLQFFGAPEKDFKPYTGDFAGQMEVALVIGHYLTLDDNLPDDVSLPQRPCVQDAPFFAGSPCTDKLCGLITAQKKNSSGAGGLESLRAHDVLGLYDGISRALLRPGMVRLNADDCFDGAALADFVNGTGGGKELVRADAKKIGIDPSKPACLWTPKKHPHQVRTLILKGARDSVIAGCQAEDFYRDGLKGERALLEFRGMGHAMFIPTAATDYGVALRTLLEKFQDLPVDQFRGDPKVLDSIKKLQAEFREPAASRAGCPS